PQQQAGNAMSNLGRFLIATALMFATAALLQARGYHEVFPPRLPLKTFPMQLGSWTGNEVQIDKDVLDILGPGEFELRNYTNSAKPDPDVSLFLASFPTQRTGATVHSPKNCLPGAGWTPIESKRITLTFPGHASFPANRYVIARGDSRA